MGLALDIYTVLYINQTNGKIVLWLVKKTKRNLLGMNLK